MMMMMMMSTFQETSSDSSYGGKAIFAAEYYWSYTIFRNKEYNQKYLGCDGHGNMTLVDMTSLDYPNPQTLFILNKVPKKEPWRKSFGSPCLLQILF